MNSRRSSWSTSIWARIEAYDDAGPKLNSFISLNPHARDEAIALDTERAASGARGPLHGIPVVVKDNINTADMPTTAGSLALDGFKPTEDAFRYASCGRPEPSSSARPTSASSPLAVKVVARRPDAGPVRRQP